jgi:hypothetical protein
MPDLRNAVASGRYAQKQILSRDKLIAWSHARRFATAFLALAMMGRLRKPAGVGVSSARYGGAGPQ